MRVTQVDCWRKAVRMIDDDTESLNKAIDLVFTNNFANVL